MDCEYFGLLRNFRKKQEKKTVFFFFKRLKVAVIKCRDKSQNKMLREEKVVKYARFPLLQITHSTSSSFKVFSIKINKLL